MFKVLNLINFFPLVSGSNTKRQFVPRLQKTRASFSQKVFFGFFVVLNILLLSNFLYGVNQNASSGYEMKALQNKISVLSEENTKLQMKVSEISSMSAIQTELETLGFVTAETPKFLQTVQYTLNQN